MSKIRNYPTSGVRSGRVLFRYNEIELYPRAELHIFSKQHYSQVQVNGRRNFESETPYPHMHTDKYLHIRRFKKLILASIYPKEMLIVLAMHITINPHPDGGGGVLRAPRSGFSRIAKKRRRCTPPFFCKPYQPSFSHLS